MLCFLKLEKSLNMHIEFRRYIFFKEKKAFCLGQLQPPIFLSRFADPPHFNANPEPDPAFPINADLDPAPLQSDGNLGGLVYRPSRAPFLSLQASIVSVTAFHGSILSH